MKKIISIALLAVLLTAGGLVLGPGLIDWNKYKPEIISRLQDATGHEYAVLGNIELAIIPMPRLKIENLSVKMPAAWGNETIVALDKVAVDVELMPLLQKQIVVKSVELVKPVFNLGVRADGTAVWMTPELQKKLDVGKAVPLQPKKDMGSAFSNAISLNEVRITDGAFSYSDARKKSKISFDDIDLDIQGDSLNGPYKISGQLNYQGQPVKLSAKSGEISDAGAAMPVQAELQFANATTTILYSGVVATKPAFELQGETTIKSSNFSDALKALTGAANPALAKSVAMTGIMTFKDGNIDYKNMALDLAGAEATGSISVKNFQADAKPLDIVLVLKSDKPMNLDNLLSPEAEGKTKAGFIPETIPLPRDIRLKADISAKAVKFKEADFSDVSLSVLLEEKGASGILKAVTPGQGKVDAAYKLLAGSVSRTPEGGVILGDLSLILDGSMQASVPQALVKPFVAPDALKGMGNLLTTPASAVFKLAITPATAKVSDTRVSMLDTDILFNGTYQPRKNGTRDLLTLAVSAESLDADVWLKRLQPASKEAVAPVTATEDKKIDVTALAKKLTLPMDLDAHVSIGSLSLQESSYDNVVLKGRLIGNKLTIDTADLEAADGNSLSVAGTIGDVSVLKDVDLTLRGKTPDTEKMFQDFKVDTKDFPKGIGPSEVLVEFKGQPDNLSFIANAKALKGTMEASGALDDVLTTPKVNNLTIRIKHPNYVELARILNPDFKSNVAMNKNLDVYTSMNRQDTIYTLKDFQATIGPSIITGQVSYNTADSRPKLTANLSAGDLALSDIVGVENKTKGTVQARTAASSDNTRWSRNAINTAWMRKYDAEFKLTARSLTWVNWRMDDAVIDGKLDNGVLTISRLNSKLYGGTMNADATISAPAGDRSPLTIAATTKLSDVSLESFVSAFSGAPLVKARGAINLDAAIETSGVSPSALIFDLKGKGTSTGKDLVFEGFDLAKVSRTLVQPSSSMKENIVSLLDTSMAGGQTAFETLDGAFTISEGVINFEKLLLTGATATVNTTGKINLPLWTMDLENTIQLVEPADAPPLKTSFRGSLDNPGKTLGKSALDSYIGTRVEKVIGDAIMDKLQDKGIMQKPADGTATPQNAGDVIQNLIQQKLAPKAAAPSSVVTPGTSPTTIITPTEPMTAPVTPAPVVVEPLPAEPAAVVPEAEPQFVPVPEEAATPAPAVPEVVPQETTPEASPETGAPSDDSVMQDPIGSLIENLTDQ